MKEVLGLIVIATISLMCGVFVRAVLISLGVPSAVIALVGALVLIALCVSLMMDD
jgi:hypothetical protein